MKIWNRLGIAREDGVSAVLVAIALVAIMGMLALVVDGGALLVLKRRMVNATDAGALAAAESYATSSSCAGNQAAATTAANQTAQANLGTATPPTPLQFTPNCTSQTVTVSYQQPSNYIFARIWGGSSANVSATATAHWGAVGSGNPVPIMMSQSQLSNCGIPQTPPPPGGTTTCTVTWSDSHMPYFAALDFTKWNDPTLQKCQVSASTIKNEIDSGGTAESLNPPPQQTPVCADNGVSTTILHETEGKTLTFPIVADTAIADGGPSGGLVVNVIGFVTVHVDSSDSGAKTLTFEWSGASLSPGDPGTGADFGMRAVNLTA